MRSIVAILYISIVCFLGELTLAIYNTWKFLIKQRKYKTWFLLLFYVLTISLVLSRIYYTICFFWVIEEKELFGHLLKVIIKINLGVVQCWILFELGLRITLDIRQMRQSTSSIDSGSRDRVINNLIKYGRCCLLSLIIIELTSLIVFLGVETAVLRTSQERNQLLNRWVNWCAWCFFSLSLFLIGSVAFLIYSLYKKRDQVLAHSSNVSKDVFNKEIRALLAILVIFSSTYIVRGVWDLNWSADLTTYTLMISSLFIGLICDFGPITLLMVFHYKNFNQKQTIN